MDRNNALCHVHKGGFFHRNTAGLLKQSEPDFLVRSVFSLNSLLIDLAKAKSQKYLKSCGLNVIQCQMIIGIDQLFAVGLFNTHPV